MLYTHKLSTPKEDFYDITTQIREYVHHSKVRNGIAVVYCPHTSAGITINENCDSDVVHDMLLGFNQAFPDRPDFQHAEGNSAAHLKASAVGSSVTIIVENGELLLGTWQGIYFCEFDPPRKRSYHVKIISDY